MTTQNRSSHVGPVGSDSERILRNSNVATADRTPIYETDYAVQLA